MTREICKRCGRINAVGFKVPDEVWDRATNCFEGVLCVGCFASYADESLIEWEADIQFFPVSLYTHQRCAVESAVPSQPIQSTAADVVETPSSTREQWMIGKAVAGVVNALNAPFCSDPNSDDPEEVNRDLAYIRNVASVIAEDSSPMAIEDAIQVLQFVLDRMRRGEPGGVSRDRVEL